MERVYIHIWVKVYDISSFLKLSPPAAVLAIWQNRMTVTENHINNGKCKPELATLH